MRKLYEILNAPRKRIDERYKVPSVVSNARWRCGIGILWIQIHNVESDRSRFLFADACKIHLIKNRADYGGGGQQNPRRLISEQTSLARFSGVLFAVKTRFCFVELTCD